MSAYQEQNRSQRFRRIQILSCLVITVLGFSVLARSLTAQPRDSDGTRMQAQKVALGTTLKDTLAPPSDSADWRYIQIEKATKLTISVSSEPAARNVTVSLTTATGSELSQTSSSNGRLEIARQLDPGIYYINIQSGGPVSYRMSIQ